MLATHTIFGSSWQIRFQRRCPRHGLDSAREAATFLKKHDRRIAEVTVRDVATGEVMTVRHPLAAPWSENAAVMPTGRAMQKLGTRVLRVPDKFVTDCHRRLLSAAAGDRRRNRFAWVPHGRAN